MSEQAQGQNQQDSGKIERNYNAAMSKLTAVLGGKTNLLPQKKLAKDTTLALVETLLKERKEKLAETIKAQLSDLLDKHVALTKAFKEEERKLAKLKEDKQKEFTEATDKVLQQIDGIQELEASYLQALNQANSEQK